MMKLPEIGILWIHITSSPPFHPDSFPPHHFIPVHFLPMQISDIKDKKNGQRLKFAWGGNERGENGREEMPEYLAKS